MAQRPSRWTTESGRRLRWAASLTAAGALLGATLQAPPQVHAATITVTITTDPAVPGAGQVSLRSAILSAADGDTIVLPAGDYTLTDTTSAGGPDDGTGGDLDVFGKTIIIQGAGADTTTIDASGLSALPNRVIDVLGGAGLTLSSVTVTGGETTTTGGAIQNAGTLTVSNSILTDNQATSIGGGIANLATGTASVVSSTVSLNTSAGGAGGTAGGGISNAGTLSVRSSLVFSNSLSAIGANGGGIANSGDLIVVNSTVAGNSAPGGGGGIASSGTSAAVLNSTIRANNADSDINGTGNGGGLFRSGAVSFVITNTIVAGNNDLSAGTINPDISGGLTSGGNNLIGNNAGGGSEFPTSNTKNDLVGTSATPLDPLLGALADNGGATLSYAPLAGSPVLGGGDSATCAGPLVDGVDQRGRTRNASCDIGAVEAQAEISVAANGNSLTDGISVLSFPNTQVGVPVTRTITVSNTGIVTLTRGVITPPTGFSTANVGSGIIAPGTASTFDLVFTPSAAQQFSGTLEIDYDDGGSGASPFSFIVNGTGTAGATSPEIAVLNGTTLVPDGTGSVNLGTTNVNVPISLTLTISNSGNGALTLSTPTLASPFSASLGSTNVAANGSTTLTITLSSATTGNFTRTLTLNSNDGDESPYTFSVSGVVTTTVIPSVPPALIIDSTVVSGTGNVSTTVNFGTITVGQALTKTITISNANVAALAVTAPQQSLLPPGVSIVGSFPSSVGPNGTTSFVLRVAPSATGSFNQPVSFSVGSTTFTLNLQFTGQQGQRLLYLPLVMKSS